MGRQWTSKELKLLKDTYLKLSDAELGIMFNRSEKAVKSKLGSLGLNRRLYNFYTTEDRKKIMDDKFTIHELAEMYTLSHCTIIAMRKAWGFKFKWTRKNISKEEIDFIKENYNLGSVEIAKIFNCKADRITRIKRLIKKGEL